VSPFHRAGQATEQNGFNFAGLDSCLRVVLFRMSLAQLYFGGNVGVHMLLSISGAEIGNSKRTPREQMNLIRDLGRLPGGINHGLCT
jgi:hypothetical protein